MVQSDIQCDEDAEDAEEHNGTRDIQALPASKETVLWVVNSGWMVFCKLDWETWR
ncbi:protein of unknown function [Candidatus Nitrotoga arctica]|uniref:Uncharacterized protein n=1 Tax=Candidatus Nitrotoga arctica TaxID=453162 RepID=A0ABN8AQX1_9PROT|nr:protein of unknown function [Candidatus Nitrotoga arctica]